MRPLFTVHAGEYLVGSYIETKLQLNVWVPSKDVGIDLLVTDKRKKALSIQVKFSKDHLPGQMNRAISSGVKSSGWWKFPRAKLATSEADFWVLVLLGLNQGVDFVIAKPCELLERYDGLERGETIWSDLSVTKDKRCWETRGDRELGKEYREFTDYLNDWSRIGDNGRIAV